jgi:hypothetical protein
MQSPPDIMDLGGRAAIHVGDLLAIEVVARTEYPPDVARHGGATRTSVIRRYELLIFAESRELLVFGKDGEFVNFDILDTERRVDDLLHVFGDAALCIRTVEAAPVPVVVEVRDEPPDLGEDLGGWDHVAQADLLVHSGRLGVSDYHGHLPLDAYPVARGRHRVRVYYGALDAPRAVPGQPGRFLAVGHHYRLAIWPVAAGDVAGPVVLKRWARADAPPRSRPRGPGRPDAAPPRTRTDC